MLTNMSNPQCCSGSHASMGLRLCAPWPLLTSWLFWLSLLSIFRKQSRLKKEGKHTYNTEYNPGGYQNKYYQNLATMRKVTSLPSGEGTRNVPWYEHMVNTNRQAFFLVIFYPSQVSCMILYPNMTSSPTHFSFITMSQQCTHFITKIIHNTNCSHSCCTYFISFHGVLKNKIYIVRPFKGNDLQGWKL